MYIENILHHPKLIVDKKESIKLILEAIQQRQTKVVTTTESILRDKKEFEGKLLATLELPLDSIISEDTFIYITLDHMLKATISMLTAFIRIRFNSNVTTSVVIPRTKGTPLDVRNKIVDKNKRATVALTGL